MRRHKLILVIPLLFPLVTSGDVRINGLQSLLSQADRLALLYNWPKAAPLYSQAESLFRQSGQSANPVPHIHPIDAARSLDGPMMHSERDRVALP